MVSAERPPVWAGDRARNIEQVRELFPVYALGFIAISLEVLLLNLRAWQLRGPLRLDARERAIALAEVGGWCIPPRSD